MQTIRRLYVYAVAFVSLEVVLWGVIELARSLASGGQIGGQATRLAQALAFILVGIPVFGLHWWLAQRAAQRDPEERSARLRAVFLYGGLLAMLIPAAHNALALIARLLAQALGLNPFQALIGGEQSAADNLIAIALNVLLSAYFYYILRKDWAAQPQGSPFPETRRLYRYIWMLYGLAMTVFGAQQVIQYLLKAGAVLGSGVTAMLTNGLALLLVGAPIWVFAWLRVLRSLDDPGEAQSLQRLLVLYILTFIGAVTVLSAAGVVLYHGLRFALGQSFTLSQFLAEISSPLSIAITFGAIWAYYNRALDDAIASLSRLFAEAEQVRTRTAALRRLYFYVLSGLGLAAVFAGLNLILGYLLDVGLPGSSLVSSGALRDILAAALASLLVGAPLWLLAWRPMLREAGGDSETADHARRSLVRKAYLYLVIFAGVVGLMFSTGEALFELIRAALGDRPQNLMPETLQLAKLALLFALLLAYHWQALQGDNKKAARSLARRHAQFPVLVLAPDEGEFAERMLAAIQREAGALPVAAHPYSQGAPDESLSAAKAVVMPAELLARPSEAMRIWLQGYSGARLVVPTPAPDWHWVYGSGRSLASLARQTARAARELAEGDEVPPPPDTSPWATVVYVMAALFGAQILFLLVALVLSLLGS